MPSWLGWLRRSGPPPCLPLQGRRECAWYEKIRMELPHAGEAPVTDYALLERQAHALLEDERDFLANAANFAAFVYASVPAINWAGFYFPDGSDLVLGPFAGKPACTRLPAGKGVCGAAFAAAQTVVVTDVDAFEGHIVCDSDSRSEIVVPLLSGGHPAGVFDVDSPHRARFGDDDRAGMESLVGAFLQHTTLPPAYRPMDDTHGSARINERIDVQTCRDHHVMLAYLAEQLETARPEDAGALLRRFRSVLQAHLKLEDDWLYPRLTASKNAIVRAKAERYRSEMGSLRANFDTLLGVWTRPGAIESAGNAWHADWRIFYRALQKRIAAEDHDLYFAAEADLR